MTDKIRISHGFERLSEKDKADNELEEIIAALEPEKEDTLNYIVGTVITVSYATTYATIKLSPSPLWGRVSPAVGSYLIGVNG